MKKKENKKNYHPLALQGKIDFPVKLTHFLSPESSISTKKASSVASVPKRVYAVNRTMQGTHENLRKKQILNDF